jgi:hypothetical protein
MKNASVFIRNSRKDETFIAAARPPTRIPTPAQLAIVPRRRARPAKAPSEARETMYSEFRCFLIMKRVVVKAASEYDNILLAIGTIKKNQIKYKLNNSYNVIPSSNNMVQYPCNNNYDRKIEPVQSSPKGSPFPPPST